jgi:hypothetical protein
LLADLQALPYTRKFIAMFLESRELDKLLTEFLTWEPSTGDEHEADDEPPNNIDMKDGWNAPTQEPAQ